MSIEIALQINFGFIVFLIGIAIILGGVGGKLIADFEHSKIAGGVGGVIAIFGIVTYWLETGIFPFIA